MSIACTLGLAACMTFMGETLTQEEAIGVLSGCDIAARSPASTFQGATGMGIAVMDSLDDAGLRIPWPRGANKGGARKALALRVCSEFNAAYSNPRNWSE